MNRFRTKRSGRSPRGGKPGVGFYLAMLVCLMAIGAAAWTTVNSLRSLSDLTGENGSKPEESRVEAEVKVSGVENTSRPSSQTESSQNSAVTSKSESRPTVSRPGLSVSKPSESSVQTNHPILPPVSEPTESAATSSKPAEKLDVTETTFILPVAGGVLKPYSESEYSMTFEDWRAHNGVDLKASKGSTVLSIGDGTVKSFGWDELLGYVLTVDYGGGIEVSYCGLSDTPTVKEGDKVKCGQTLGIVADIPSETVEESHLHLEVRVNGELTEPLRALGKESKLPSEEE